MSPISGCRRSQPFETFSLDIQIGFLNGSDITRSILEDNLEIKTADVIDLDADDNDTIKCPAKPFGYNDCTSNTRNQSSRCERDNKEPTAFGCEPSFYVPEETSFLKHTAATGKSTFQEILMKTKLQNVQELPVLRSMNVTTSTWKKESPTIGGISKQATRLASGTGPQTFHNLNSLSGEFFAKLLIQDLLWLFLTIWDIYCLLFLLNLLYLATTFFYNQMMIFRHYLDIPVKGQEKALANGRRAWQHLGI